MAAVADGSVLSYGGDGLIASGMKEKREDEEGNRARVGGDPVSQNKRLDRLIQGTCELGSNTLMLLHEAEGLLCRVEDLERRGSLEGGGGRPRRCAAARPTSAPTSRHGEASGRNREAAEVASPLRTRGDAGPGGLGGDVPCLMEGEGGVDEGGGGEDGCGYGEEGGATVGADEAQWGTGDEGAEGADASGAADEERIETPPPAEEEGEEEEEEEAESEAVSPDLHGGERFMLGSVPSLHEVALALPSGEPVLSAAKDEGREASPPEVSPHGMQQEEEQGGDAHAREAERLPAGADAPEEGEVPQPRGGGKVVDSEASRRAAAAAEKCVTLDCDSATLERAIVWMMAAHARGRQEKQESEDEAAEVVEGGAEASVEVPEAQGDGAEEEEGGAHEREGEEGAVQDEVDATCGYGMDQMGALNLLLFADFLQCDALVQYAAVRLAPWIDSEGEVCEQLVGELPPQLSLRVAEACSLETGGALLRSCMQGMEEGGGWWTLQMLCERAEWVGKAADCVEGGDVDLTQTRIAHFLGRPENGELLSLLLERDFIGSSLLLKVSMVGGRQLTDRGYVREAWGRAYVRYIAGEREKEMSSDRFLSMAEPCLPERLEPVAYDDPQQPLHTASLTDVLFALFEWFPQVPSIVQHCTSPPPPPPYQPSRVSWTLPHAPYAPIPWPQGVKIAALTVFGCEGAMLMVTRSVLACPDMRGIRALDFEGCGLIEDGDVAAACERLPHLASIDVKGAERLTDASLRHMARLSARLETLQIGGCRGLTDAGMCEFAAALGKDKRQVGVLLKLSLMNCSQLTNTALCAIAEHLTEVRDLCIYGCYRMTDDAIIRIKRSSAISRLNTSGCYKISDMGIRYLMQVRPSMLIYHKHRDFYKPLTARDMRV